LQSRQLNFWPDLLAEEFLMNLDLEFLDLMRNKT
jgi:hypothetical protein